MRSAATRVLAFYLPQYHPIPENDAWWGKGFTDWMNVAGARPRFRNHRQPQIPADLGFYDLRLEETRIAQADLARSAGLSGFCYYHYWFNGKILLGRPLEEVLSSGKPDYPFCVCWANENWTRAWDGLDRQVLMRQDYTDDDAAAHVEWFLRLFTDRRYIHVNGRPLLLLYRPDHVPQAARMIAAWRARVREAGFPDLYLCAVKNGFVTTSESEILEQGYDAVVDFQPNRNNFPTPTTPLQRLYALAREVLPDGVYQRLKLAGSAAKIVDYRGMVTGLRNRPWPIQHRRFPCVFPSWDNTARRKTSVVIQNDDPRMYQDWLEHELRRVGQYPEGERLVFINAWNEWAEGCHLEPDRLLGHSFLDATREAISFARGPETV